MLQQLSCRRILKDGLVLSVVFTIFFLATLYANPWLWFADYPPQIRAMVDQPPAVPMWQRAGFGLAFVGMILYLVGRSAVRLLRERPTERRFALAAVHTFLLYQFVNAWDVVIVDWLFFVTIQPSFAILPGTERSPGYDDYWFHFSASYLSPAPWLASIVLSLVVAAFATWWVRRKN